MSEQQKSAQAERPEIVDDPSAPVVFVEGCIGGGGSGGTMMLTFATRVVDHSGAEPRPYLMTNLRMMIPPEGAKGLADFINSMLVQSGAAPTPEDIAADRSIQ